MIFICVKIHINNPGVYIIRCVKNNKLYVGSSVNIKNRISRHFNDLLKQKHSSPQLQNSYNKYGNESFVVEIVEEFEKNEITLKELHRFEQKYLDEFKPYLKDNGFNTCRIAGSPSQYRLSDERKKQISESLKGRVVSDETRKKISESRKGKTNPKDAIERMRLKKIGSKQSEETILKKSREYSFIDSNGYIHQGKNLKRFCDEHGLHRPNMKMVLNGKRKTHHGFKKY